MTAKTLDLAKFLPFRLSLASNLVSRAIARTYEEAFGLTMTQWRLMAVLGEEPGLSATDLTRRTALDKVAVSRAAAALVKRGLVKREAEPGDARRAALSLTKEGTGVYGEVIPQAAEVEARLLTALDEEERKVLDRALRRLCEAAGKAPALGL